MSIHDREHLEISDISHLYSWLERNNATSEGLWVVTHKKSSEHASVSYGDIVDTVLMFGWIDSVPGKVDEHRSKLYLSPRKKTSAWSAVNKKRVERLISQGRMRPEGQAKIDEAQKSGMWNKIDSAQNLIIPEDLEQEFATHSGSKENFVAFPPSTQRAILEWIIQAKKPETRKNRIEETAELAAQNKRANQWQKKFTS